MRSKGEIIVNVNWQYGFNPPCVLAKSDDCKSVRLSLISSSNTCTCSTTRCCTSMSFSSSFSVSVSVSVSTGFNGGGWRSSLWQLGNDSTTCACTNIQYRIGTSEDIPKWKDWKCNQNQCCYLILISTILLVRLIFVVVVSIHFCWCIVYWLMEGCNTKNYNTHFSLNHYHQRSTLGNTQHVSCMFHIHHHTVFILLTESTTITQHFHSSSKNSCEHKKLTSDASCSSFCSFCSSRMRSCMELMSITYLLGAGWIFSG